MQGWNSFRQNLNLNIVNVESVDYRIIFVKFVLGKQVINISSAYASQARLHDNEKGFTFGFRPAAKKYSWEGKCSQGKDGRRYVLIGYVLLRGGYLGR